MRNKPFGTISKVYFNKIVIEVPSPTDIHHNYMGDLYILEGLNDFITIYTDQYNKYIYQIISLYEQEVPLSKEEDSKFHKKAYFEAVPLGEVSYNKFEYGLATFPMIGEEVYLTTVDDLQNVLTHDEESLTLVLGELTTHEYIPEISVDSLFTNHMAVLGNTGSGKSTTVRTILNRSLGLKHQGVDPNKMNFIVFDLHNEYEFDDQTFVTNVDINEIAIPLETLLLEDWINLVQPASAVQLPVLMNGLRMASILESDSDKSRWIKAYSALELYNNQQTDAITKRAKVVALLEELGSKDINDSLAAYSAQYGSFNPESKEKVFKKTVRNFIESTSGIEYEKCAHELLEVLQTSNGRFCELSSLKKGIDMIFLLEEAKGNAQVRQHCQTMMIRVEHLIYSYSKSMFDTDEDKQELFDSITKYTNAITIFDCSEVEDEDLLFLSGYISRRIFDVQREEKEQNKIFNIVLDEAHRYLTEENNLNKTVSLKVFEQIAKEGRKFGTFLMIASQRPSELSTTVLSQCNNFILHRIRNNIDLDQMRKSVPYINDSQLFRLSYLKTGVALMVGESFVIPMEIDVDGEDYSSSSDINKPTMLWKE